MPTLPLDDFSQHVPEWFARYCATHYYQPYCTLAERLRATASVNGCLELDDLCDVADWGGNQRGLKSRLRKHNTPCEVRLKTADAYRYMGLDKPKFAIGTVLDLEHWGLTYASKTLMFMDPTGYVALDDWMRKGLKEVLPPMHRGSRASEIRGYLTLLDLCREWQSQITEPCPGHRGTWELADVQSALFQFCKEGGVLVGE